MACGFSPKVMEMLHQLQEERRNETQNGVDHEMKHYMNTTINKKNENQVGTYDWTTTYSRWDKWEDPEELIRKEEEERTKVESQNQRRMCDHDHSAERELMEMTTVAKLDACEEIRKTGNLFFHEGQFQRAFHYYQKALVYFEYIFTENEEEENRFNACKLKCLLNASACKLKNKEYDLVIQNCNQVLQMEPKNIKAYFRRAQGYREKDEYDLALQDIHKALEFDPGNPLLRNEMVLIHTKKTAYSISSKKVFGNMFKEREKDHFKIPKELSNGVSLQETPEATCDSFDLWKPNASGIQELENLEQELNKTKIP